MALDDVLQFYCLGYIPNQEIQYLGLERWNISELLAIISNSDYIADNQYKKLVDTYSQSYLSNSGVLQSLDFIWLEDTKQIIRSIMDTRDLLLQVASYQYHVIAALDTRGMIEATVQKPVNIVHAAEQLGFSKDTTHLTFLGYDIVEPYSHWSILYHASEWGRHMHTENAYQLCESLDEAHQWLTEYINSNDSFMLPAKEHQIVALYELAKVR